METVNMQADTGECVAIRAPQWVIEYANYCAEEEAAGRTPKPLDGWQNDKG